MLKVCVSCFPCLKVFNCCGISSRSSRVSPARTPHNTTLYQWDQMFLLYSPTPPFRPTHHRFLSSWPLIKTNSPWAFSSKIIRVFWSDRILLLFLPPLNYLSKKCAPCSEDGANIDREPQFMQWMRVSPGFMGFPRYLVEEVHSLQTLPWIPR